MKQQSVLTINAIPTGQEDRILLLDSLRGMAVLGILVMNIPGFAQPHAVIGDPTLVNFTGANYYSWLFVEGIFEGSQRALFSMLFGAGMLLFISRLEDRLQGLMPAEYFVRRQLWLLFFGLFNAYVLLWFWDILFHYAILGMMLFAFRRLPVRKLLLAAGLCLLLQTVRENVDLYRSKAVIERGALAAAHKAKHETVSALQEDDIQAADHFRTDQLRASRIKDKDKNIRNVLGPYAYLYRSQSEASFRGETRGTFYFLFFDVLLCMFLGMAFYKNGWLMGQARTGTYALMCIGGLGAGLLISWLRLQPYLQTHFSYYEYVRNVSFDYYEISRILRAVGIFGLIMLLHKSGWFNWLFALMQPVGQIAFTNYLMQSFLCGMIFYGVGFGMFGKLQPYEMYYVVGAIWGLEIAWSHIWLRYFRFGPMEWIWRSLTYWKLQPLKKRPVTEILADREELVPVEIRSTS
jgi:uncharacterized protein